MKRQCWDGIIPPVTLTTFKPWLLVATASLTSGKPQLHSAILKYSEAVQVDPTFFEAYEGNRASQSVYVLNVIEAHCYV